MTAARPAVPAELPAAAEDRPVAPPLPVSPVPPFPTRLLTITLAVGQTVLTSWLLIVAQDILIPLATSMIVWYILNALTALLMQPRLVGRRLPVGVALAGASLLLIGFIAVIGRLVVMILDHVQEQAPQYQQNLVTGKMSSLISRVALRPGQLPSP